MRYYAAPGDLRDSEAGCRSCWRTKVTLDAEQYCEACGRYRKLTAEEKSVLATEFERIFGND